MHCMPPRSTTSGGDANDYDILKIILHRYRCLCILPGLNENQSSRQHLIGLASSSFNLDQSGQKSQPSKVRKLTCLPQGQRIHVLYLISQCTTGGCVCPCSFFLQFLLASKQCTHIQFGRGAHQHEVTVAQEVQGKPLQHANLRLYPILHLGWFLTTLHLYRVSVSKITSDACIADLEVTDFCLRRPLRQQSIYAVNRLSLGKHCRWWRLQILLGLESIFFNRNSVNNYDDCRQNSSTSVNYQKDASTPKKQLGMGLVDIICFNALVFKDSIFSGKGTTPLRSLSKMIHQTRVTAIGEFGTTPSRPKLSFFNVLSQQSDQAVF